MTEFTYDIPDEKRYFAAIQQILIKSTTQKENQIGSKLKGGKCSIVFSSQFSGDRWNAYSTSIHFYVSLDNLQFFDKEAIKTLLKICDRVMPKNAGFDIKSVEIAPMLEDISIDSSLTSDLEEIQNSNSNKAVQFLPNDIKEKGKEMSEVYAYLYCVENSLRLFIEKVFTDKIGTDYSTKILVSNPVKKSIQLRKEAEQKNQWISIRGNSDLFYLDFKELGILIINNWQFFKKYFPDQQWINVKIDELGNCRNLIAHNSYVSPLERDVIRLNYNQILKQIKKVENEKGASDDFVF